jgi:hypothetical protein
MKRRSTILKTNLTVDSATRRQTTFFSRRRRRRRFFILDFDKKVFDKDSGESGVNLAKLFSL